MPVGAVDQSGSAQAVLAMQAAERPQLESTPSPTTEAPAGVSSEESGVVVALSDESIELASLAEKEPPKERTAPQPDMGLTRALDGVDMSSQDANAAATASADPQTRTTDPAVIAQAVMAS